MRSVVYRLYSSLITHADAGDLLRGLLVLLGVVYSYRGKFASRHGYLVAEPLFH